MSQTPLDVLVEEAKSLYRAEAERYGSLYGRIGVFMAVFAIYANALVWFFQNGLGAGAKSPVFISALVVLTGVTAVGFGSLMFGLSWGEKYTAMLGPRFWGERRDALRQPAFEALLAEGVAAPTEEQIERRVAVLLNEDLVEDLTRCTERNMNLNERRFAFLHRAGQFAGAGFLALMFLIAVHVCKVWREPPQAAVARVQVVGTVGVAPVQLTVGGSSAREPQAAPAESATASSRRSDQASAATAERNQGGACSEQDATASTTR